MVGKIKTILKKFSYKSRFFSELYQTASAIKNVRNAKMPDDLYLRKIFKKKTGRELDLENPHGFNEKLQWLKLYNRNPKYTELVDKVLAKEYVASVIGMEHIIPTLGIWDNAKEIDFENLPNQFVLKCNHNSGGGMFICKDKSAIDIAQVRRGLNKGIKTDSYLASREWPYKNVNKKIFAEKYMEDRNGSPLIDYKFYCFNGEPKFLYVALANYHDGRKNDQLSYLNLDWTPAPFYRTDHKPFPYELEKPSRYDEMIEIAKKLSAGIPFVRIDLYCINDAVYFSEFTFSPGGGFNEFQPYEWEERIGTWIDLSLVKKNHMQ